MALKHTAVFKLGPFPPEFSRDDITKAFYDEFSSDYTVLSIPIVPGGVVKVYFNSAEAKKGIFSWKAMIVSGVECQVLNFSERSTLVQVHHYPAQGNDDDLVNVSKEFGEVIGSRSQQLVGLENITTGTRLCEMKLSRDIPRNLRFDKMRLKVWYRDQPLECDICKGENKASECALRDKCRLCKSAGHFARDCPNPWGCPASDLDPDRVPAAASALAPTPAPAPSPASSPVSVTPSSIPVPVLPMVVSPSASVEEESASQSILQGVFSGATACISNSNSNVNMNTNESNVSNVVNNRDFKQITTVTSTTSAGSKEAQKRRSAHASK